MALLARMLDESKSIISNSEMFEKVLPLNTLKGLVHTSNSERTLLKQSKALLFIQINEVIAN